MRRLDTSELTSEVERVVRSGPLGRDLTRVDVEPVGYSDAGEFIRVTLGVRDIDAKSDGDLDAVAAAIEGAIETRDDRFPSVRFAAP